MTSTKTSKVVSSRQASISTKLWMVGSVIVETALTIITWAVMPLFFKFWTVICLCIDMFLIIREFVLNPVQRKAVYA